MFTFTATQAKTTPGTVRFDEGEREDGGRPRSFYVPLAEWRGMGEPEAIHVTVQAAA